MRNFARLTWPAGVLSAGLLLLPFSIAGPVPVWRTFFAWLAFAPLIATLLHGCRIRPRGSLRRGFLGAYLMGVLWYLGNCYWIYRTMLQYGGLPPLISFGILLGFSLVLGLYFGAFGLALAFTANITQRVWLALAAAPFYWAAIELLSSRITRVPWDLLGYSQVDNLLLNRLAPITGVYGLSFVLMVGNVLFAAALLAHDRRSKWGVAVAAVVVAGSLQCGVLLAPASAPVEATAVLVQPNLSVDVDNSWPGVQYGMHVGRLVELSRERCGPYFQGLPQEGVPLFRPDCRTAPPTGLVAWPESPAPFRDKDPRFRAALRAAAAAARAPAVSGNIGVDENQGRLSRYNSALFVDAEGRVLGRYDKVHLVPWGEYVPYQRFFSFAGNLTQEAGDLTHGWQQKVFSTGGHTYGIFICYEEIFGDEVRKFTKNGADVLVNLSDDGWYGNTSAPWQTLNMARMRAVENRRWLLRDTNNGITSIIDPQGRITASAPRDELTVLAAPYGYETRLTFYTRHGDLFAKVCGIISLMALAVAAGYKTLKIRLKNQS